MESEFRAILEEIVRREGGVEAAGAACELPPGTFSRWLNRPKIRPDWPGVVKVALHYAARLGMSSGQVVAAAGYSLEDGRPPRLPADLEIDEEIAALLGGADAKVRPALREMVLRNLRDMGHRYGVNPRGRGGPDGPSTDVPREGNDS